VTTGLEHSKIRDSFSFHLSELEKKVIVAGFLASLVAGVQNKSDTRVDHNIQIIQKKKPAVTQIEMVCFFT
jgi:hypothetical protein